MIVKGSFFGRLTALACIGALALAGCTSGGVDVGTLDPAPPTAPQAMSAGEQAACEQLAGLDLAGVSVGEAAWLEVSERQVGYPPALQTVRLEVPHCRITGVIDSSIRFELLMPDAWNGNFMMGGGGGFVGSVQNQAQDGLSAGPTPLERGYATAGTDTGHTGSPVDASWALGDPEAQENFAHRAVHRTAEVSKAIIAEHYGTAIEHSYFLGCSRGGGQAMISAQRYPEDFDGLVAAAPALDWPGVAAGFIQNQQQVFPDPSDLSSPLITPANRSLLADALAASCDADDGVTDGILTDPRGCTFDPSALPRCTAGPADDCLTERQLEAIEAIYSGPRVDGEQVHPGFPFGGETDGGGWDLWATGPPPPGLTPDVPNLHFAFGTQLLKYFVYEDPEWSYAGYTFEDFHDWAEPLASLLNATDPDLSALRDRGGKIILWHGWSDSALTALDSIEYYQSVEQRDAAVRDYLRMFLLPGVGHCGDGPGPDRVDWIGAIERWVEEGEAPDRLTALDSEDNTVMTRPLCPYPQAAAYDGSGDADEAQSFTCETPPTLAPGRP